MLGKLLKHEFKETWKLPVLVCVLVFAVFLATYWYLGNIPPAASEDEISMAAMMAFLLFTIAVICGNFALLIYLAVRFYKNLYTDEGYLMHTLPVTPRSLILSKLILSSSWMILISFEIFFTIFPVMERFFQLLSTDPQISLYTALGEYISISEFVLLVVVSVIISSISSMLTIYASISLGQLFGKHKVLASVLCYIGFSAITQIITSIFMTPYMVSYVITLDTTTAAAASFQFWEFFRTILRIGVGISALLAVLCYILTEYIMKKCLNLD